MSTRHALNRMIRISFLGLAILGLMDASDLSLRSSASTSQNGVQSEGAKLSPSPRTVLPTSAASSKNILIYGPSLDPSAVPNEATLAQAAGHTVTVVDQATWAGMTTAQFGAFDAIVFGDPSCFVGTGLFTTLDQTKSVWSPAITGAVYIQGTDPVWHGSSEPSTPNGRQMLITGGINFAASGSGTGLYVTLSCYAGGMPNTRISFLSELGTFTVNAAVSWDDGCVDDVKIVNTTHPAVAGLSNESLSNWQCSVYQFITDLPPTFEIIAEAGGSSVGADVPYIVATRAIPLSPAGAFVTQHYRDFLNREPDTDGLAFWTKEIEDCGTDAGCLEAKHINVSGAFFLSIEFQESGYFVYRTHKATFGSRPAVPLISLSEFLFYSETVGEGVVVNQPGWETTLENNKQNFTARMISQSRGIYPTWMKPDFFVDTLFTSAGVTPDATDRTAAINEFGGALNTSDMAARARALRRVADNPIFVQQDFNRAFVMMQYFGYLRRNPYDPPEPGLNYDGYDFWVNKLNQFNGNYVEAEMVKAFLTSTEYRQRFDGCRGCWEF